MQFEQLEAFLVVAQTKNFTKASEILHVSQSTVTNRIRNLEEHLGKKLFERDNKHVQLTAVGETFKAYAFRLHELKQESQISVQIAGKYDTYIAMGSTPTLWEYVLYPLVNAFRVQNPRTMLKICTAHSPDIIQYMLDGLVDVAIVNQEPYHNDIVTLPFFEDEMLLVKSPRLEIPQIQTAPLRSQQLPTYSFIHMNWGKYFIAWFSDEIGVQYFPLYLDNSSLFINYLLQGEGMGFLPESVAKSFFEQGELVKIPFQSNIPIPKYSAYLLFPKKRKQLVGRMVEFMFQVLEKNY